MAVTRVDGSLAVLFSALFVSLIVTDRALHADVVELLDAKRLEGKVIDLGNNAIVLERDQSRRKIFKKEIKRLTFSIDPKREAPKQDMVIRRSGEVLLGRVEIGENRQEIMVHIENGAIVSLRRKDVARIRLKDDPPEKEGLFIYDESVDQRLKKAYKLLSSSRDAKKKAAQAELVNLGIFAIPRVERTLAKKKLLPATRAVLRHVHRLHRIKCLTPTAVERLEPDVYEILGSGDADRKQVLLQRAFTYHPDETIDLLEFLLLDSDEDPAVRGYGVSLLKNSQRNRDLLRAYHKSSGQLQLALAIALGRNRILVGVPALLDSLDMDDRQIRELAIDNLREISGTKFGYHPADVPSSRREAIARWGRWWKEREGVVEKQATAVLAGRNFDTPERVQARKILDKAAIAQDQGKSAEAEELLRRASRADTHFVEPALQLAVLLYTQKGENEEARRILEGLAGAKNVDSQTRLTWVNYHLGRIHELDGNLEQSIVSLNRCIVLDRDFFRARMALGQVRFATVVSREGLTSDEKYQILRRAREDYQIAVQKIEDAQARISLVDRVDLPVESLPLFDVREHNRAVLSVKSNLRLDKSHCLMGISKTLALLGKQEAAVIRLAEAVDLIAEDDHRSARRLLLDLRNYLGMLYENLGQYSYAYLEYKRVLRDLNSENQTAQEGMRRVRPLIKTGR
jgi:tetratricopeptide (TPR) repeat protein